MIPFFFFATLICLTLAMICFVRGLMHQQRARYGYLVVCAVAFVAAVANAFMVFSMWPS
jgi:hypothetical protein